MKALKFYDKEGVPFELFVDYDKQSVVMQVDDAHDAEQTRFVEFDDQDLDDIIISIVELKNQLTTLKNINNN